MVQRMDTLDIEWGGVDQLPNTCILLVDISLDKNNKLPRETENYLQDRSETYKRITERPLFQVRTEYQL